MPCIFCGKNSYGSDMCPQCKEREQLAQEEYYSQKRCDYEEESLTQLIVCKLCVNTKLHNECRLFGGLLICGDCYETIKACPHCCNGIVIRGGGATACDYCGRNGITPF